MQSKLFEFREHFMINTNWLKLTQFKKTGLIG